ncbi:MAG: hypothetical protein Kow0029_05830 [Candidatus Rifleibacteriota bacterium]
MGALSTFKVMKVEDYGNDVVTFRTSRVCTLLGALFIFAGLGIVFQLLVGKLFFTLFSFCLFCLFVSGGFLLAGLILVTYNKTVKMNVAEQKVVLLESSLLGARSTAFHFNELMSVELTRESECIFSNHGKLWVVKAYLHHEDFAVERIFATINPVEAKQAAETLAHAAGKELIISCQQEERLIFGRI